MVAASGCISACSQLAATYKRVYKSSTNDALPYDNFSLQQTYTMCRKNTPSFLYRHVGNSFMNIKVIF